MHARIRTLSKKLGWQRRSLVSSVLTALNYVVYKSDVRRSPRALHAPLLLQVEPTSRCNLRCPMCMRDKVDAGAGDMSMENFKRLLDQVPRLPRLHLQGNGEPFLHPDLVEFIRLAKERGTYVTTITNGTRITADVARRTVDAGLDELQFSVDSLEEEDFARLRVGARLPEVIENIRHAVCARDAAGAQMTVSLAVVVQRGNREQLADFIRFCRDMKLQKISLQYLEPKHEDKYTAGFLDACTPFDDPERLRAQLRAARSLARDSGVEFDCVPQRTRGCHWPWDGLYVTWDGNVTPCCLIFDPVVGNAFTDGIDAIWNGTAMRTFRRQLRTSCPPAPCARCSHYPEWEF